MIPRPVLCLCFFVALALVAGSAAADGCESNRECRDPAQYCQKEDGDCDGEGKCAERPGACTQQFDPVCGCDGKTYGNACGAAAAGVNVAHEGQCRDKGCKSNEDCGEGELCHKRTGDCDGEGRCEQRPEICPQIFDPVCGCDGKTYSNSCFAATAGTSVAHAGECRAEQ